MFKVFLSNFIEGSGTSYGEEFDHLDNYMTAQDYILNYDGDLASKKVGEDIELSITDEDGYVLSSARVSEVLKIKYQAVDQAGHVLTSSTEDDRKKAIIELVNELSESETFSFWYDSEDDCIYTCEGEPNKNADDLECIDIVSI